MFLKWGNQTIKKRRKTWKCVLRHNLLLDEQMDKNPDASRIKAHIYSNFVNTYF